jgi:pyruvate dehydrogenase (quinone)
MSHPTIADQLLDVLREAGVERIYGLTGDSLNPVVDTIRRGDGIEFVHVRNERRRRSPRRPRSS